MQNWLYIWLVVGLAAQLTACNTVQNSQAAGMQGEPQAACSVTQPSNQAFIPPSPYPPDSPYEGEFWYGTEALWTLLSAAGTWRQLPQSNGMYSQKTFWWKKGYDWQTEPLPSLTVTGKRLDAPAPPLEASVATNGFHDDLKSFMLVGVDLPTAGCWEITGHSEGHDLSFVVWVEP